MRENIFIIFTLVACFSTIGYVVYGLVRAF